MRTIRTFTSAQNRSNKRPFSVPRTLSLSASVPILRDRPRLKNDQSPATSHGTDGKRVTLTEHADAATAEVDGPLEGRIRREGRRRPVGGEARRDGGTWDTGSRAYLAIVHNALQFLGVRDTPVAVTT